MHPLDGLDLVSDVLQIYKEANSTLAAGLLSAWTQGKLTVGIRAILPYVALHHLNRFGSTLSESIAIARTMADKWNPHTRLRGHELEGSTFSPIESQKNQVK